MELYDHPVNQFVAGFIGSPQMNFFDVTVENGIVKFQDGNTLKLSEGNAEKTGRAPGRDDHGNPRRGSQDG